MTLDPLIEKARVSHVWKREQDEHYVEPAWLSERLFIAERFDKEGDLWDPAAGLGTIPRAATNAGFAKVHASDLVDRVHGGMQADFLRVNGYPFGGRRFSIVCNPPFKIVHKFVDQALSLKPHKAAFILPTARLNAAAWLEKLPLYRIYYITPRPSMAPGNASPANVQRGGGKTDYCWIVFLPGYEGYPQSMWLHGPRKRAQR